MAPYTDRPHAALNHPRTGWRRRLCRPQQECLEPERLFRFEVVFGLVLWRSVTFLVFSIVFAVFGMRSIALVENADVIGATAVAELRFALGACGGRMSDIVRD